MSFVTSIVVVMRLDKIIPTLERVRMRRVIGNSNLRLWGKVIRCSIYICIAAGLKQLDSIPILCDYAALQIRWISRICEVTL